MRICFIAEGCYPYVVGGVSSWIQTMITNFPEHEFSIIAINPDKEVKGKFKYTIPDNVYEIQEIFLDVLMEKQGKWNKPIHLSQMEKKEFTHLLSGEKIAWPVLFDLFTKKAKIKSFNSVDLLLSKAFYKIIQSAYGDKYSHVPFTDVFWTLRSMYITIFALMEETYVEADIFHSVATGYAGIVGALIKHETGKPLILTEHGIYTREREEELIKSDWVQGYFKDMWIKYFKNLSDAIYDNADQVVSLFEKNKEIQVELGCERENIDIIHNGVKVENFAHIERVPKTKADKVLVAGILRVVPIKDIKTMIQAFSLVASERENVEFLIMGPTDEDEVYYQECLDYMDFVGGDRITFTGRVDVRDYLGKIDIHVLTSISEGQPLSVLEAMTCHIPNVTTNVGDCMTMVYGSGIEGDCGQAGIVVNIMDYRALADALIELIDDEEKRLEYGENGYQRVMNRYGFDKFITLYKDLYNQFA